MSATASRPPVDPPAASGAGDQTVVVHREGALPPQQTGPDSPREKAVKRRAIIGTGLGNGLEWFDWQIYTTFAAYIALQMFQKEDPTSALLSTLAIFAVGFVARPIGGLLFGLLADKRGRKFSLLLAIALASVGSLIIAVLPPFGAIGPFASLLLLVARLIQGLAHGGEMPSAQTYISEVAPRERRGLWASLIYFSGMLGIIAATLMGAIITTVFPETFMAEWGWRLPFLVAALLGVYTLVMRTRLKETDAFEEVEEEREEATEPVPSLWSTLNQNWPSLLRVCGLTVGLTVAYYVWGVTAPAYAANVLGMDRSLSLWFGVLGSLVFVALLPVWGIISDRIGRKPVMLIGAGGAALAYFPASLLLSNQPWTLVVSMSLVLFFMSASSAIMPAVYAELFPTGVRTIGLALPYGITVALLGGTAPYLQTWFASHDRSWMFSLYAVILLAITFVTALFTPETKGKELNDAALA